MKQHILILAAAAVLLAACSHHEPKLDSRSDTLSWVLGQNVAQSLMQGPLTDIDRDIFLQAVANTLDGKPQPLSDEQYQQALDYIVSTTQIANMRQSNDLQRKADTAQERYFADLVAKNPDVRRHPSGFYYQQLKAGSGPNAKYSQRIVFDYRGFLMLTGQPFDQTYGKRDPIVHVVGNPMFPGLIEAFQLMNAGSIYRFYFPYQLAFGAEGSETIPPFSPVIYEIELHQTLQN